MKKRGLLPLIAGPALLVAAISMHSCTSGWTQFRGPGADMVITAKDLPTEWGEDRNIAWTYDLAGSGWASPVVWGNHIFLTTAFHEEIPERSEQPAMPPPPAGGNGQQTGGQIPPPSPQEEAMDLMNEVYRWEVTCVDVETGEEIWKKVARQGNPRIKKHANTNFAAETPVTDGKRLYVYFGMHGLYCYNLEGELLWEKDLGAYKTQNDWGTGSSPVVYKDLLFVQVDNEENSFLLALDAATGEEVWKVQRDEKTNYSTPYIWENSERTELVVGGNRIRSYDPASGELLWELLAKGRYSIPSPVADQDHLYVGNAGFRDVPGTFFAVKAGAEGDITPAEGETSGEWINWSDQDAPTGNPSPLLYEGLLYIVGSRGGEIVCLEAASGQEVYREKVDGVGACWASPWACGDRIYFYDERGVTSVIRAGREFELMGQNKLEDRFWASIAVTPGAYLMKGLDALYCIGE